MCCFAGARGAVARVSRTRIFARALDERRQATAYEMSVTLASPAAMVLPIPVPEGCPEDAVTFLDLEPSRELFTELDRCFVSPEQEALYRQAPASRAAPQATLAVHRVGAFDASFAPTRADLSRLDPRFRLGDELFTHFPEAQQRGFVVFQLARDDDFTAVDAPSEGADPRPFWRRWFGLSASKRHRPEGATLARKFHPMGFTFPRKDPSLLFFPTVHLHDGSWSDRAEFDHQLYLQTPSVNDAPPSWERASLPIAPSTVQRAEPLLSPSWALARTSLRGSLPNEDHYVRAV